MDQTGETIEYYRKPPGIVALWTAVLAGPVAWMIGFSAIYGLVLVSCAGDTTLPLHLVSLAALLITGGGALIAWKQWNRTGAEKPGEGGGTIPRSRFMAVLGLLTSALFGLAIVAQWIATLFLHPCMGI